MKNSLEIQPGDFIAIRQRRKAYDSMDKCVDTLRYDYNSSLGVVVEVDAPTVYYTISGWNVYHAQLDDCVKIPKDQIDRYCELKGTRDILPTQYFFRPSDIKPGDTIWTNYEDRLSHMEYTVLGVDKGLVVCTRPNRNRDIVIVPVENCFVSKETMPPVPKREQNKKEELDIKETAYDADDDIESDDDWGC